MTSFIPSADSGSCRETRTILSRPSRNSLASTVWIRLSFPTRVRDFERFACLYRTPCTTRCTHQVAWYLVSFDRFGRSHRTLKPCILDTVSWYLLFKYSYESFHRVSRRLASCNNCTSLGMVWWDSSSLGGTLGMTSIPFQRVSVFAASFHRTQHALKQPCKPLQNPAPF